MAKNTNPGDGKGNEGNEPIDKPVNPNVTTEGFAPPAPAPAVGPDPGFSAAQMDALKELIHSAYREQATASIPRGQAGAARHAAVGAGLKDPGDGPGAESGTDPLSDPKKFLDAWGELRHDRLPRLGFPGRYPSDGLPPSDGDPNNPRMTSFGDDGSDDGTPRMMTAPTNPYNPGTPNNDFIHGIKGKLKYTPVVSGTAGTPIVYDVEQYTMDLDVGVDDITNTSAGGAQVVLDGIRKITGTVMVVYDSFNNILVSGNPFRPGNYVTLNLLLDGVTPLIFAALMHGFSTASGPKAGTVRLTVKYQSTGPITYPTASQTVATTPLSP